MIARIDVPATLSNLGPGFDVLGMAIDWTNTFRFAEAAGWDEDLSLATAREAARVFGAPIPPLSVTQEERIPRARGLGSSATARVAGLLAWRELSGCKAPLEDLLAFLVAAEGHPDNALPAVLGGLVLASTEPLRWLRVEPPDLRVALCIPSVEVSTDVARAILPREVPRADAVFNVGRAAFLVAGLLRGDPDAIRHGLDDRLHQPWRKGLIGPVDEAFEAARSAGAIGSFVSGSGSTLAAFVGPDLDPLAVADAMAEPFVRRGISCDRRAARPIAEGAATWASTSR